MAAITAAAVGSALQGIGSIIPPITNAVTGVLNYGNQKNALAFSKDQWRQLMEREDTAIQRRKADLKAAGINPILAAGQGASTSAPTQLDAPQLDLKADGVLEALRAADELKTNAAQRKLFDANANKANWEGKKAEAEAEYIANYELSPDNWISYYKAKWDNKILDADLKRYLRELNTHNRPFEMREGMPSWQAKEHDESFWRRLGVDTTSKSGKVIMWLMELAQSLGGLRK